MTPRRICRLDGWDIWRIEYWARPRWPFSLFVSPRWLPTYRWNIFLDHRVPMEYTTRLEAVAAMERLAIAEAEQEARDRNGWTCNGN